MTTTRYEEQSLKEKIETLDGSRSKDRQRAAVRITDLSELMRLSTVRSSDVTSAPTAAEYNKLRADVLELNNRLQAVILDLQERLR
jgi:hypothetical protein